jgi:hypothetical protein
MVVESSRSSRRRRGLAIGVVVSDIGLELLLLRLLLLRLCYM